MCINTPLGFGRKVFNRQLLVSKISPLLSYTPYLSQSADTALTSRGEKGILAHPQRPPNFREKLHFSTFFLLISTETKITHPKSHFTYAIKHNFSLLILSTTPHTFSSCDRIDFGKIPKISNSF